MAWGILEDKSGLAHVPGTILLDDDVDTTTIHHDNLKKIRVGGEDIILVPQPANDPNDPLTWPLWARDLIFCMLCFCVLLVIGGIGPILSSLALELTILFNVSFTKVSLLTGYSLCATGAIGLFISASTRKYGKRFPLLFSMTCALVGTIWGGFANSYDSLLGARIVQGFSAAFFESVIFSIIGDLYFVHERGLRTALTTTCTAGISNLPPVLAGKIATTMGWRWVFWLLAIFLGIGTLLCIFFGLETAYNRASIFEIDTVSQDNLNTLDPKAPHEVTKVERHANNDEAIHKTESAETSTIARKSYLARLNPYSGTYTSQPLWKLMLGPIEVLANPIAVWAVLLIAFPTLWLVAINLLIAQVFSAPPYLLSTAELGYMSAGPAVGGFVGAVVAGALSDPTIRWAARKNKGVYEPEFRLFLIVPAMVLSAIGYFCFGAFIQQGKSPAGMSALWGVATASLQMIMQVVGTYCVDGYRDLTVEIFIATMVIKNFLFFGFSYILNTWIVKWGPARMFYCVGSIQIVLCLSTVLVYIFGKRLRAWWHVSRLHRVQ